MCSLPYRPAWWLRNEERRLTINKLADKLAKETCFNAILLEAIDEIEKYKDWKPPGWVFELSKKIGREVWKKL